MTFAEFLATGRDVADLSTVPEIAAQGIEGGAGRVYADALFIETATMDDGAPLFTLTIGNMSCQSHDEEKLVRQLYDFAVSEGYVGGEPCDESCE